MISGQVNLDKPELNLNSQTFQLARTRETMSVSGIEAPDYPSSGRVALSISASEDGREVKLDLDGAMGRSISRGPETLIGTTDELRARKEALERGVDQATVNGLREEQ